jgi:hypothetical protein
VGALRGTFGLALAAALVGSSAHAQDNSAIAEQLFNDARHLLDQGKADQACPKFAESLRLAPTLGTRLNLARCYEVQGRTATAWGQYKEVIRTGANDTKRATIAAERVAALEPQLPHIMLSGHPEAGLKVRLDNDVLDAAVLGTAVPVDPGDHEIQLSAPDKKTRTTKVHVDTGQTQTLEVTPLESALAVVTPVTETPTVETPHDSYEVSQGKRVGGWVAIGTGAVALGVGIAFGIVTLNLAGDLRTECPGNPCSQDGVDKNSAAHTDALFADILIPVGVVAAGIGTWLVATASHRVKSSMGLRFAPLVSTTSGGLAVTGRF